MLTEQQFEQLRDFFREYDKISKRVKDLDFYIPKMENEEDKNDPLLDFMKTQKEESKKCLAGSKRVIMQTLTKEKMPRNTKET